MRRVNRMVRWIVAVMLVAASVAGGASDRSGGKRPFVRAGWELTRGPEWGRELQTGFQRLFAPLNGLRPTLAEGRPQTWQGSPVFRGRQASDLEDLVWAHPVLAPGPVAYSPDGTMLAMAALDRSPTGETGSSGGIALLSLPDGNLIRMLKGNPGLGAFAFSPDGTQLASIGGNFIRVWRVQDGSLVYTAEHYGSRSLAFSPTEDVVASIGWNRTLRLWQASEGVPLRTLPSLPGEAWSVALSSQGLLAAGGQGETTIWQASDGAFVGQLPTSGHPVSSVAFTPDGALLVTGDFSPEGHVHIWRTADGNLARTLDYEGSHDHVTSVAVSHDGRLVAAGSWDGTVKIWQVTDGSLIRSLPVFQKVRRVAFSPDSQWVAAEWEIVAGQPGSVVVWRVKDGLEVFRHGGSALAIGEIRMYRLQIPAGDDFWVTLHEKRETWSSSGASLWRGSELVASSRAHGDLVFHLRHLQPGEYTLVLEVSQEGEELSVWAGMGLPAATINQPFIGRLFRADALSGWGQLDMPEGVGDLDVSLDLAGNYAGIEIWRDDFSGRRLVSEYREPPLELTLSDPEPGRVWTNTLDNAAPTSHVVDLPEVVDSGKFPVTWEGADAQNSSGLQDYTVYVSDNGNPSEPWLRNTTDTSATFTGKFGHTYRFYTVARDHVGNQEMKTTVEAQTKVGQAPTLPAGLQMVSVPVQSEQADPQAVFGFQSNKWARYDPTANNGRGAYVLYDNDLQGFTRFAEAAQVPGRGYWVKLDQETIPQVAGPLMEDTQPLAVPLQTGWNMIGNPFLQAVERDLSAIQVQKGTEKKSLTGAQEAGWIEDFAWGWEGSAYRLIYDPSVVPQAEGVLNPWQGYWVKANQDCTLLLPPPGIESTVEAPGEVTLAWPELGRTSSRDASFTLVDLTTGTRRYMRTTSGYTYHPSRGETQRRFQIVAEPGPGNPLQITALQATPTRGPERGAQITFQLNRSAATEVTVLTLTGRVVSPIEQGRTRTAGLQQAVWTGQDEEGRPVPPGVYLVEVVATDEEGQQVRAVRTVRMP